MTLSDTILKTRWRAVGTFNSSDEETGWYVMTEDFEHEGRTDSVLLATKVSRAIAEHICDLHNETVGENHA